MNDSKYEMTRTITPKEYLEMRAAVGWSVFPEEQAVEGLAHSYVWCIRDNGRPIAIGRAIWDHGYVIYIADIIVLPDYQGQGLGRTLMESIMEFIREQLKPGYRFMVSLLAAKGKEAFYQKFGFEVRPNETVGAGMHQWLVNEENK